MSSVQNITSLPKSVGTLQVRLDNDFFPVLDILIRGKVADPKTADELSESIKGLILQQEITGRALVEKSRDLSSIDPLGLKERYANNELVQELLVEIERGVIQSQKSKIPLNLSKVDFRPLNNCVDECNECINLENLLSVYTQNQYPFKGANLRGAILIEAILNGATLIGADLRRAYLIDANLRGADLTETDLKGTFLCGADLEGAYTIDDNGQKITGEELREYLVQKFNVLIEDTKF